MKKLALLILMLCTMFCFASCKSEAQLEHSQPTSSTQPHVHQYGSWEIVKNPTCSETGLKERTCSCNDKETRAIFKLKHKYSSWQTIEPATCTNTGTQERVCGACGEKETIPIPKRHTEVIDIAVAATCSKNGLTEGSHCSICGTVIVKQEETPKTGQHKYESWKLIKAATCTSEGVKEGVCSCGQKETEIIAKTDNHTVVIDKATAATCTTEGLTEGSHCSKCNTVIIKQNTVAIIGHAEVIDEAIAATCTTEGKTEGKHCSVCNTVLIEQNTIALSHDYKEQYIQGNAANNSHVLYTCSKCNDNYKEDIKPISAKISKSVGIMLINGVQYNTCIKVSDMSGGYGSLTAISSDGFVVRTTGYDFEDNLIIYKPVVNIYLKSFSGTLNITVKDNYGNSKVYQYIV